MQLSALHRYPLKSGRGQELQDVAIGAMGIDDDRAWMLIDAEGRMITGREFPAMVRINAVVDVHGACFSAPDQPALRVRKDDFSIVQECTVWKQDFVAWRGDENADTWFSRYLGVSCRLLYIGDRPSRRLGAEPEVPLSFADGYPLLLIGQGSLDDLNSRLARPVPMLAFRPNLVITGSPAFAEDRWRRLRIGEVRLELGKPCTRCIFTTVDPDRGEKSADREPLLTLARYRRFDIGTCFGVNLIVRAGGRVRLGDPVIVLA